MATADDSQTTKSEHLTWSKLFFKMEGRIGRKTFWLRGVLPFHLAVYVLYLPVWIYYPPLRLGLGHILSAVTATILMPVLIKRLHDRNRPAWLALGLLLPSLLRFVFIVIGYPEHLAAIWFHDWEPKPYCWVSFPFALISIWLFIETALLRGTQGPNRYGVAPMRF